jgi:CpXC protein
MVIRGKTHVTCPECNQVSECELVQTINTRDNPTDKERLLAGELNMLDCPRCSKRTQLAANILFRDPERDYYCQVVPGDDRAMAEAAAAFAAAGAGGTQRLVPTLNALVEKIKILDAHLVDWAIEQNKVLLLASLGELERVLLFDAIEADLVHWILFDEDGRAPQRVSSPFASYEKLAAREVGRPKPTELRIDRAWAIDAVQAMIAGAN